jgi:hypothetical protein
VPVDAPAPVRSIPADRIPSDRIPRLVPVAA